MMSGEQGIITAVLTSPTSVISLLGIFFLVFYLVMKQNQKIWSQILKNSQEQYGETAKQFDAALKQNYEHNREILTELKDYLKEDYKVKSYTAEVLQRLEVKTDQLLNHHNTNANRRRRDG